MRISDWSSDVCSSDLFEQGAFGHRSEQCSGIGVELGELCLELGRLGRDRPAFILPGGLYSYADYIHRLSPAEWIVKQHGATYRPKYIRRGKDCLRNGLHRYHRMIGSVTAIYRREEKTSELKSRMHNQHY